MVLTGDSASIDIIIDDESKGYIAVCICLLNNEIHAVFLFPFFFNFVCDVILFENEFYILINSVTRFDDTMGTVYLSSFEVCVVSTNVIEDN